MKAPKKVLFVCTGNICRSPTAEGILRHLAREAGLPLTVASAGTHDYHVGAAPDHRSLRHARGRGYDLSDQRARQLREEDFEEFDLILAMDRGHLRVLRALCPSRHQSKVRLLVEGKDVPDPYYGGPEGFEAVLDMVEAACRGLVAELRASTG